MVPSRGHFLKDRRNLHGGFKPIEDALVGAGLLSDDHDGVLRSWEDQVVIPRTTRVEVWIHYLHEGETL